MDKAKMKIVYAITSREAKLVKGVASPPTRAYWNRVGIAFVNSDGSLNVKLEALPVSGELHIRDYTPRREATGAVGKSAAVSAPRAIA
jgi:hypothetical protein